MATPPQRSGSAFFSRCAIVRNEIPAGITSFASSLQRWTRFGIEEPSQDNPDAFVIRNIGKGPAFQVFPSTKTAFEKKAKDNLGNGFVVSLQMAPVLAVDESASIRPLVSLESDPCSTTLAGVGKLAELVVTDKITETFTIEIY